MSGVRIDATSVLDVGGILTVKSLLSLTVLLSGEEAGGGEVSRRTRLHSSVAIFGAELGELGELHSVSVASGVAGWEVEDTARSEAARATNGALDPRVSELAVGHCDVNGSVVVKLIWKVNSKMRGDEWSLDHCCTERNTTTNLSER